MKCIGRTTSAAIFLLGTLAASASAQASKGPYVYRPQKPPTREQIGSVPPSPPPQANQPRFNQPQLGYGLGNGSPIAYGSVPVVLTNDGRVFADFGYGYEQVLRSCSAQYGASMSTSPPAYTTPTYTLPNYGGQQSMPYTPPAPALPTGSEQMIAQMNGTASPGATPAPSRSGANAACWTADAQGRIIVVRP